MFSYKKPKDPKLIQQKETKKPQNQRRSGGIWPVEARWSPTPASSRWRSTPSGVARGRRLSVRIRRRRRRSGAARQGRRRPLLEEAATGCGRREAAVVGGGRRAWRGEDLAVAVVGGGLRGGIWRGEPPPARGERGKLGFLGWWPFLY
jgi:hypothetical protein